MKRKSGVAYRVVWRDLDGVRHSRTFTVKADADLHDREMKRLRETGVRSRKRGDRVSLSEYVRTRWVPEHVARLAPSTQQHYRSTWLSRVQPELGGLPLTAIDVPTVKAWHSRMLEDAKRASVEAGADRLVGQVAIERALSTVLSSILRSAVEDGLIEVNPVTVIKKSRVKLDANGERRKPDSLVILDPFGVERLRSMMDAHDATLVAVLAYAGLRPGEAWRLTWDDVNADTIRVWGRKTATVRYVPLRPPLAAWLEAWREHPDSGSEFVFAQAMRSTARRSSDEGARDHRAWNRRRFRPAVEAAGLPEKLRPYDLRHTCASLLNAEHMSTAEAAAWMGHGHQLYLQTYCHIVERYRGRGKVDINAEILAARLAVESGKSGPVSPKSHPIGCSSELTQPARISESPVAISDLW